MDSFLDQVSTGLAMLILAFLAAVLGLVIAWLKKRFDLEDTAVRLSADDLLDRIVERNVRVTEAESSKRVKMEGAKLTSEQKHDDVTKAVKSDLRMVGGRVGKAALKLAAGSLEGRIGGMVGKLF